MKKILVLLSLLIVPVFMKAMYGGVPNSKCYTIKLKNEGPGPYYITEVSEADGSSLFCTTQHINTVVSNNGPPKIMSIKCWISTTSAPKKFSIKGHNGKGGAALDATVTVGKTYTVKFKSTKEDAPKATIEKTSDNDYILFR